MEKERGAGSGQQKKGKDPKKNFNLYWAYAVIGLVLIAIQLVTWSSNIQEITPIEFKKMVLEGDVDKVEIVNKKEGRVFLKRDQVSKYEEKISKPLFGSDGRGPHMYFNLPYGEENFSNFLNDAEQDNDLIIVSSTEENWGREIISWVVLIGIMVLIWVFVMRRIGGGGGPGGQIFNIGKSRAQIFEGGKSTDITFDDVAGLAGAKEEVEEIVDFLKNPKKYTDLGA